ncbi:TIGR02677 family protein [Streptomyces sp. NPDC020379]|uniref:TIGR02677 family protein n=1 Tax=Streptomyces sp. NPDC020379 TaxID=3365071 RepID=UPI00379F254E
MAQNARAFMGSLRRTIDLHDVEEEVFLACKDRLIQYLERFIQDLITLGGRIVPLLRTAAVREATAASPEDAEHAEREAYARWTERWEGLAAWFLTRDGRESQARPLRGRALGAIHQFLAVVRSLNERRAGRSDRSADFWTQARWFAEAPDGEARHRLWRTAFGLHPSRHLTVDAETLAAREARPVPAATSWAEDGVPLVVTHSASGPPSPRLPLLVPSERNRAIRPSSVRASRPLRRSVAPSARVATIVR